MRCTRVDLDEVDISHCRTPGILLRDVGIPIPCSSCVWLRLPVSSLLAGSFDVVMPLLALLDAVAGLGDSSTVDAGVNLPLRARYRPSGPYSGPVL